MGEFVERGHNNKVVSVTNTDTLPKLKHPKLEEELQVYTIPSEIKFFTVIGSPAVPCSADKGDSFCIYRTWRNIGGTKYWRMHAYQSFGGNKLANHF